MGGGNASKVWRFLLEIEFVIIKFCALIDFFEVFFGNLKHSLADIDFVKKIRSIGWLKEKG